MAKKKMGKVDTGKKDYVDSLVETAKETAKEKKEREEREEAEKAKEEKAARQAAMESMTEPEKLLFMSQEEILAKEKDVAKREEEFAKAKELFEKEKETFEREKETFEKEKEAQAETRQKEEERIQRKTEELDKKKAEHTEREKQLSGRDKEVAAAEKKLSEEKKQIDRKKSELNNQERELLERENNAEAGFLAQNERSLEALRKTQEELQNAVLALQQKKVSAEEDIAEELQKIRKVKLEQIEKEMEAYKKSVEDEVAAEIKVLKASASDAIEQERVLLEETKKALEQERKEVNDQKNRQEKQKRQIEDANSDIQAREEILREDREEFETKVEAEVEQRVQTTKFELEQEKEDNARNKARLQDAQNQIAEYRERERAADGASAEELIGRVNFLETEKKRLETELAQRPGDEQLAAYQSKAENYDRLVKELRDLTVEKERLERKQEKFTQFEIKLADARDEVSYYKKMVDVTQLRLQKYSEEVDRFRSLYEQPKELENRLGPVFEHEFEAAGFADTTDLTETGWLDNIYTNCENSGVVFNRRLLKSFHTALKTAEWSPLTVLAGVSGTGKSLLPDYYCRFGGIYFKPMAVQPDWDSPQTLFGFFNSIDNRFNATNLIRAMVQFVDFKSLLAGVQKILGGAKSEEEVADYLKKLEVEKYNLNDAMFMVLLDEMNLAHVELYFSDMLSKLERRRNSDESVNVEIDMGAGMGKFPLKLSDSILWVGTMNEDETTKSLSDKVLDRGNLISFPRPTEFKSRKKIKHQPASPMLRKSVWKGWVDANVIEDDRFSERIEKYRESLQRVNGYLGHAGRALGHRVWQSIENYMANHPDVISAFPKEEADKTKEPKELDEALCEKAMRRAFEEALVHKVMPKLRGIETSGDLDETCIEPIKQELFGKNGLAKGLEKDFNNALDNPYETFLWCSAEYLDNEE